MGELEETTIVLAIGEVDTQRGGTERNLLEVEKQAVFVDKAAQRESRVV